MTLTLTMSTHRQYIQGDTPSHPVNEKVRQKPKPIGTSGPFRMITLQVTKPVAHFLH